MTVDTANRKVSVILPKGEVLLSRLWRRQTLTLDEERMAKLIHAINSTKEFVPSDFWMPTLRRAYSEGYIAFLTVDLALELRYCELWWKSQNLSEGEWRDYVDGGEVLT